GAPGGGRGGAGPGRTAVGARHVGGGGSGRARRGCSHAVRLRYRAGGTRAGGRTRSPRVAQPARGGQGRRVGYQWLGLFLTPRAAHGRRPGDPRACSAPRPVPDTAGTRPQKRTNGLIVLPCASTKRTASTR